MNDKTTIYHDLNDQHIFITGGATGIGAEMVRVFTKQGAKVAFIDYDEKNALSLFEELKENGSNVPWFKKVDVTNVNALENAIKENSRRL